ncbi:hypothetical protein C4573_02125 [Candidatus Woesearchaeota archaeon]|nr:MAG: hypothetical protein C4573_02125 [Candidatus Woesearchaeota archaeon]
MVKERKIRSRRIVSGQKDAVDVMPVGSDTYLPDDYAVEDIPLVHASVSSQKVVEPVDLAALLAQHNNQEHRVLVITRDASLTDSLQGVNFSAPEEAIPQNHYKAVVLYDCFHLDKRGQVLIGTFHVGEFIRANPSAHFLAYVPTEKQGFDAYKAQVYRNKKRNTIARSLRYFGITTYYGSTQRPAVETAVKGLVFH